MFAVLAIVAVCLGPPVDGPVDAHFAPIGMFGGHWGVDFTAETGDEVRAPASGRVTFAGSVAGMRSITIEPVEGFKVSVSYLSSIGVVVGESVARGQTIARAGAPHGESGVHMSVRIGGVYVDPIPQMGCRETDISRGLWLLPPPQPPPRRRVPTRQGSNTYPQTRANWDSWWNVRPDTHRPPTRR